MKPKDNSQPKKPGPVANPNYVRTSVVLDKSLLEWGKNRPGGLSAAIRECLENMRRQQAGQHSSS